MAVDQSSFINFLKSRLDKSLPGKEAQLKMAPTPESGEDERPSRKMEAPPEARQSSVLILLFPNREGNLELLLTLRSSDINHGGQISLPGGRSDRGEDWTETALREAYEEVGIDTEAVEILGHLSELYVSHSNNRVKPVVGFMDRRPALLLNPHEVDQAFTVELESLATKKNLNEEIWELEKNEYRVPYWDVHKVPLWGATAMILSEFLEIYREYTSRASKDK